MAYVTKTTKIYKDGKLVNVLKESMSESKYRKDLTRRITNAQLNGYRQRLFLGSVSDVNDGKIDGMKTTMHTHLGKYVYDSSYRYSKTRKRK